MLDEFVARIGCLKIAEHFMAGDIQVRSGRKNNNASNIEADLQVMNSFEQISDSLTRGEIEGAFLPLPFALNFFRKGMNIQLLLLINGQGSAFFKNGSADIKKIEDFKGKIILTPCFLSVQNMLLHKMFFSAGLKLGSFRDVKADIFLEVVPENIMLEFVKNDSDNGVGGIVASEPFASQTVQIGDFKVLCKFDSLWAGHPDTAFVLKNFVIKDNLNYVERLIDSISRADYRIGQDEKNGGALLASTSSYYPSIKIVQNYMVEQAGFLPEKVNIKEFIDTKLIEELRSK